jgi:Asp/Glu/hydantoin racemase
MSIMEMSHRGKEYSAIHNETIANIKELLNIPEATLYERTRELKKRFIEIAEFQIKTEGAQLIVAGYSAIFSVLPEGTREEMEKILGVPVIDGVAVAIRTAEMLVALSLLHSRKTYPKRDC